MNNIAQQGVNFFSSLITSKTRVKILMRLFLNPREQAHLRKLSDEFDISPSLVREELQQLSKAGLIEGKRKGKQVNYQANTKHALFPELHSMVKKALGMDSVLESIIKRLGDLEQAILIDDYAEGKDTGLIDLVLVGDIDHTNLTDLVAKTERYIGRKIRTLVFTPSDFKQNQRILDGRPSLVLWSR